MTGGLVIPGALILTQEVPITAIMTPGIEGQHQGQDLDHLLAMYQGIVQDPDLPNHLFIDEDA